MTDPGPKGKTYEPLIPVEKLEGGGSQSGLWNQIKADVLAVPCLRLDVEDPATLGGAAVTAIAAGELEGAADIEGLVSGVGITVEPREQMHRAYAEATQLCGEVLSALRPSFSRLHVLSQEDRHG